MHIEECSKREYTAVKTEASLGNASTNPLQTEQDSSYMLIDSTFLSFGFLTQTVQRILYYWLIDKLYSILVN